MKTLLVPVDFSESAYNALVYAHQLAQANHSSLVIVNCYQIPAGQGNVMIDFKDILERDSMHGLQEFQERVQLQFGITPVELVAESYYGFLVEGVEVMIKKYKVDLVVMGTTGASNFVRRVVGSNTSNLIRKIKVPVLVIPDGVQWKGWKHTVFASDFLSENSGQVFSRFKNLVNGMQVNIDVLHVIDKAGTSIKFDKIESGFISESERESLEFHYQPADNVVEGILSYTVTHPCDLLVMLRRKHGLVEKLFSESATRELALHASNPVLLLHE